MAPVARSAVAAVCAGVTLGVAVVAMAGPVVSAQETSAVDASGLVLDVEATILDVEATILDIDGGTATTESDAEVTVTLEADVFFDFDEAEPRPDATETLAEVVERIAADGPREVSIGGHTDAVGDDAYNDDLSERRAEAVRAFLAERLDGVELAAEGFGAREPVAPNETEDGRALNRRVEIRYPR